MRIPPEYVLAPEPGTLVAAAAVVTSLETALEAVTNAEVRGGETSCQGWLSPCGVGAV